MPLASCSNFGTPTNHHHQQQQCQKEVQNSKKQKDKRKQQPQNNIEAACIERNWQMKNIVTSLNEFGIFYSCLLVQMRSCAIVLSCPVRVLRYGNKLYEKDIWQQNLISFFYSSKLPAYSVTSSKCTVIMLSSSSGILM